MIRDTACLLLFVLALTESAMAKQVSVPVNIEYRYLQQAIAAQFYTGRDRGMEIWNDGEGCGRIILSNPRIDSQNGLLRMTNRTFADIGLPLEPECVPVYKWSGTIETYHRPEIEKDRAALRFEIVDARLYNPDRTRLAGGRAFELLKQFAGPQLSAMRIDLQPALSEIRQFIPNVIPEENATSLKAILDSLSFESIAAKPGSLEMVLGFTVADNQVKKRYESPLTESELSRWEQTWRQWDAFITYTIKQIAARSESDAIRETLLDVLIETRYDILMVLSDPGIQGADPVRSMFVDVWNRLAPVLREVSRELQGDSFLQYTTFMAAGDILQVLDALGPGIGLEITSDGLRRMARMLAPDDSRDPLEYKPDVDPELRKLFGFEFSVPAENLMSPDILSWVIESAHASTNNTALGQKLNNWAPSRNDINEYLPLVHQLLNQTAVNTLNSKKLDSAYQKQYHDLLLATAWQESCWRQFVRSGESITPITSSSGSVGIMQVNRKVWRGFYDTRRLETDIAYNAHAGSEILLHYLKDYVLKKELGKSSAVDSLARATYAVYNGGPRHLTRYRKSGTSDRLRKIDASFWKKYKKIKSGDIQAVANCYGETAGSAIAKSQAKKKNEVNDGLVSPSTTARQPGRLLQSNPQGFTIQLMSSRNEAQIVKYIQDNKLQGKAEYFVFQRDGETWYSLVYGSFVTQSAAESKAQSLGRQLGLSGLWVRKISTIQKPVLIPD